MPLITEEELNLAMGISQARGSAAAEPMVTDGGDFFVDLTSEGSGSWAQQRALSKEPGMISSDEGDLLDDSGDASVFIPSLNLAQVADALPQLSSKPTPVPAPENMLCLQGMDVFQILESVEIRATELPSDRTDGVESYHQLLRACMAAGCRCPVASCDWMVALGTRAAPLDCLRDNLGRVVGELPPTFKVTMKDVFTHWETTHFAPGILNKYKVPCPFIYPATGQQCTSTTCTKTAGMERHLREIHLILDKEVVKSYGAKALCTAVRERQGDRDPIPALDRLELNMAFTRGLALRRGEVTSRLLSGHTAPVASSSSSGAHVPSLTSGSAMRRQAKAAKATARKLNPVRAATKPVSTASGTSVETSPRSRSPTLPDDVRAGKKRAKARSPSTSVRSSSVASNDSRAPGPWISVVRDKAPRRKKKRMPAAERNPALYGAHPVNLDTPPSRTSKKPTGAREVEPCATPFMRVDQQGLSSAYTQADLSFRSQQEAASEVIRRNRRALRLLPRLFDSPDTPGNERLDPWDSMLMQRRYGRELLVEYSRVQADLNKAIVRHGGSPPEDVHWSDFVWSLATVFDSGQGPEFVAQLQRSLETALMPPSEPAPAHTALPDQSSDPLINPPSYSFGGARPKSGTAPAPAAAMGKAAGDEIIAGESHDTTGKLSYSDVTRAPAPAQRKVVEPVFGKQTVLTKNPTYVIPKMAAPVVREHLDQLTMPRLPSPAAAASRALMPPPTGFASRARDIRSQSPSQPMHTYDLGRPRFWHQPSNRTPGFGTADSDAERAQNAHLVFLPVVEAREMVESMTRVLDAFCSGHLASDYGQAGVELAREWKDLKPPE